MTNELLDALCGTHPDDFERIKQYVKWVKFRRYVHNLFYPAWHWVRPQREQYHWVRKS